MLVASWNIVKTPAVPGFFRKRVPEVGVAEEDINEGLPTVWGDVFDDFFSLTRYGDTVVQRVKQHSSDLVVRDGSCRSFVNDRAIT